MTTMFIALLLGQTTAGTGMAEPTPKMSAPASQSLAKVKQLALATLMYAQDHKDTLPTAAGFQKAISPYLKDPNAFTAPGAPRGSVGYFFEPRLSGVSMMKPAFPAKTAMILEGTRGKPAFPYDGRTVIAFVDGHAKLTPAKAATKARTISLM